MADTGRLSILITLFLIVLVASAPSSKKGSEEKEEGDEKKSREKEEDDEVAEGKKEDKEKTKKSEEEKESSDDEKSGDKDEEDKLENMEMPYNKDDHENLHDPDNLPSPFPSPWLGLPPTPGSPSVDGELNGDILDKEQGKEVIDLMILKLQKMNSFLEGVVTYWDEWAARGAGVEKK